MALTPAPLQRCPFLFAGRIEEGIHCAAELKFDAVELHVRDAGLPEIQPIVEKVRSTGLSVSSIGTGQSFTVDGLSISNPDRTASKNILARLFGHLRLASQTGGVVILGSVQGRLHEDSFTREKQVESAVSLLRTLGDEAARLGVRVGIEPLNRYETNFLNTVEQAMAFLQRVNHPSLGLVCDTFHMNIEERSIESSLIAAGKHIFLVHLSDSNRGPAGSGHTDFRPVISALRSIRYSGFLSAEIMPLGGDRRAAEQAEREMRRLARIKGASR